MSIKTHNKLLWPCRAFAFLYCAGLEATGSLLLAECIKSSFGGVRVEGETTLRYNAEAFCFKSIEAFV